VEEPPLADDEGPGWVVDGREPDNTKRSHDFALALSLPVLDRKLAFGVGGALSRTNHDRFETAWIGDADVGAATRPVEWATIGVSGRNLLPFAETDDLPLAVIAAVELDSEGLGVVAVEIEQRLAPDDGSRTLVRAGVGKDFSRFDARAGWRWDGPRSAHSLAIGLGIDNSQGSFDLGLEVPLGRALDVRSLVAIAGVRIRT
jgi:hypothetical protein